MFQRILHLCTFSFVLIAATACGNRAIVDRRIDDYDGAVSQTTSLQTESDSEKAGRLVGERDFVGAIEIYRRLYRNSPDAELRAESLLRWAQAEGSMVNPDRDLDQAIARLDLLIAEFPGAKVHAAAQEELVRLRGLREGQAAPRE